jgi:hypothetical protein
MLRLSRKIPGRLVLVLLIIFILNALLTFQVPVFIASASDEILFQEDFEDGDITVADPRLYNGMTWTSFGTVESSKPF